MIEQENINHATRRNCFKVFTQEGYLRRSDGRRGNVVEAVDESAPSSHGDSEAIGRKNKRIPLSRYQTIRLNSRK